MSRVVPPQLKAGDERLQRFLRTLSLALSGRWSNGADTIDDLIVSSSSRGLVLQSPNGHYWRATISNLGVVTWTDIGTDKPAAP